jgi:hypothetical protein
MKAQKFWEIFGYVLMFSVPAGMILLVVLLVTGNLHSS